MTSLNSGSGVKGAGQVLSTSAANLKGAGYMLLAMAGFTINDAFIKGIDGELPVNQVIATRGVLLLTLMALYLFVSARRSSVSDDAVGLTDLRVAITNPFVLARAACEFAATVAFMIALNRLPLAVISSSLQSMPLVVTAGAALFMSEHVGWRRWIAILVGLAGVLVILRPGVEGGFALSGLLPAVLCVVLSAGRDLFTRCVPAKVSSLGVTAVSAFVITCGGLVGVLFSGTWVPVSWMHLLLMASAAVFLFVGMQGIVLAMRTGEVAAIVPFRYTSLLWAILLGWLWFDEIPDRWTVVGSAVVVGMGLYTFARERRLQRAMARKCN